MRAIDKQVPIAEHMLTKDPTELRRQTLLEHLRELRKILLISVGSLVGCFVIAFFAFSEQLVTFFTRNITDYGLTVVYTALTETFSVQLKAALVAAFVFAAPIILWQAWGFVVPALYKRERLIFTGFYLAAIFLFAVGIVFAYVIVFGMAVNFFVMQGESLAVPMLSIDKYMDFLLSFTLPFGVVFELPLVVVVLSKIGLVTAASLKKYRKYIVFGAFVLAGVVTPTPDIVPQLMLGVPLVLLYESGVLVVSILEGFRRRKESDGA